MKISINKLAEYNRSIKAARRRKILYNAKFPTPPYGNYYGLIRQSVLKYLITGEKKHLESARKKVEARPYTDKSDWKYKDIKTSLTALNAIENVVTPPLPKGSYFVKEVDSKQRIMKDGILVNGFPELLLYSKDNVLIGGLKLHYSKSPPLGAESLKDVGHLLEQYLQLSYGAEGVKRKYCYGLDVSTSKIEAPTAAFKSREDDLKQSCADIVSLWSSINPK